MNKEILDLSQKPAVGVYLIEASAGTGKTYSIANLYLHFILQKKRVNEVLVVTFTEAATKELRERIRDNLSKAFQVLTGKLKNELLAAILANYDIAATKQLLEAAILNFDQAAIFTIHGFCQRMLQENAFESMSLFDAELIENEAELLDEVVKDFIRQKTYHTDYCGSIDHKKLMKLATSYNGQKIVDAVEKADFEKAKEAFLLSWRTELPAFKEYLHSVKGLKHNKTCKVHCFDDLTVFDSGRIDADSLPFLKILSESKFCKCAKLKLQPRAFAFNAKAAGLIPLMGDALLKTDFLSFFQNRYQEKKSALNVWTFADLINKLLEALEKEPANGLLHSRIRAQFKVALVDEFQDTDPVQYKIFSSLFGHRTYCPDHSFYMIGDPKQSIYSFRGADIFAYIKAKKRADKMFTLETNYRSEKKLIGAVNHFFLDKGPEEVFAFAPKNNSEAIEFTPVKSPESFNGKRQLRIKTTHEEAKPLQLKWINTPDGEATAKTTLEQFVPKVVSAEIIKLLNLSANGKAWFDTDRGREPLLPMDIAILTYSHYQAFKLKEELNNNNVPCIIKKSGNVFDSREALALRRFLEAIHKPHEKTIIPLFLSSFFNYTATEIKQMNSSVHFTLLKEFVEYRNDWDKRGFVETLQSFLTNHVVFSEALKTATGERIISNIYQLREIIHQEEKTKGCGLGGLIRFLSEKIHSADKEDEQYLQRLETDADAVQILTIHKSKGLEFPVVFCPYAWVKGYQSSGSGDINFHDQEGISCISLNEQSTERKQYHLLASRENLSEQLRLLYVALTRPVNRCYLYWGDISKEASALSFLAHKEFKSHQILAGENPALSLEERLNYWQHELGAHPAISFSKVPTDIVPPRLVKKSADLSLASPLKVELSFSQWMNGSYSALTRNHHKISLSSEVEAVKDDDDGLTFSKASTGPEQAGSFFAFPRGATPGTAVHEIFEHIDFQDSSTWRRTIEEKLQKYRLHSDGLNDDKVVLAERSDACLEMLNNVIHTKLFPQNFCLADLAPNQRCNEMAFYFPVEDINLYRLAELFRRHYKDERVEFADDLLNLNYNMERGFLNGSIDLTFVKDDKFYIIDWKTNHLGNSYEDYHSQAVKDNIRAKLYFLQYHIYSVALHLYLNKHLKDYSYKKNFGGVFYAFVRGMKPGTDFGLHYDLIPEDLVQDLTKMFLKSKKS